VASWNLLLLQQEKGNSESNRNDFQTLGAGLEIDNYALNFPQIFKPFRQSQNSLKHKWFYIILSA
jgi:hypothetical protein